MFNKDHKFIKPKTNSFLHPLLNLLPPSLPLSKWQRVTIAQTPITEPFFTCFSIAQPTPRMAEPNKAFSGFLCPCPFSPHSCLAHSSHLADRMVLSWNAKSCPAVLPKLCQAPPLPSNGRQTPLNGWFVLRSLVSLTNLAFPLANTPGFPCCSSDTPGGASGPLHLHSFLEWSFS